MAMPKKANGANFALASGDLSVRFEADVPVVYVVCLWGAKPQFGGQRALLWRSDELNSRADGDTIVMPPNLAMGGMQVTWSGGVVSEGEAQGGLRVTLAQKGGESASHTYEYQFQGKNEVDSFYDALNFA